MGTINNKFICVEMVLEKERAEVAQNCCRIFQPTASCKVGSNGYVFVTITPSGSKEGWDTQRKHSVNTDKLLKRLKELDPDLMVETVTTSCG